MAFIQRIIISFGPPRPQREETLPKPNLVYNGPGSIPEPAKNERRRRYRWRNFCWNLAGLFFSGAIIGCIAIVCRIFEGESMPDWKLATLSSVIAWMAAVAKLGIVIPLAEAIGQVKWSQFMTVKRRKLNDLEYADAAGRNAFGALGWLIRFRGGTFIHIGAALVIVSLGFDPSFQYLLHYDIKSAIDPYPPVVAQVRQSTAYTPERGIDNGLVFAAPQSMLWGIYSTVFGDGIPTDWQCASGNCTFPSYVTVGICSTCEDISSKLNRTCVDLNESNKICPTSSNCYTSGQLCSYTDKQHNATAGGGTTFLDLQATGRDFQAADAEAEIITIDSDLVDMTAVYIHPTGSESDPRAPEVPGYVPDGGDHVAYGFTCKISYCERTVNSAVSLGKFYESSSPSQDTAQSFSMPVLRNVEDLNDELFARRMKLTDTSEVTVAAMFALSAGFSRAVTGKSDVPRSIFPGPGEVSEFHRAMYQQLLSTSFPSMVERMAKSVTAAIRNDGTPVIGDTYTHHIYIWVEWRWFAYPAVLWALVLVVLIAVTGLASRRKEAWLGTSQLAGIMIGVDDDLRDDMILNMHASTADKREMMDLGEKLKLRVAKDRNGALEFTRLAGNLR